MRVSSGFLVLTSALYVQAQTVSLFLPLFDPQPLSADIAGTDTEGRTTYILQKGSLAPGDPEDGFSGTATLVQGPAGASFTYDNNGLTLGYDCSFTASDAVCTASDPDSGAIVTVTEAIGTLLDVQLGTTIAAASPTGSAASSGASSPSAASSGFSTARSASGSSASSGPAPTSSQNSSAVANVPAVALLTAVFASFLWAL